VDTIFSFKEPCEGIDGTAVSPTDAEGILETLTQPSSNQNSFIVWGGVSQSTSIYFIFSFLFLEQHKLFQILSKSMDCPHLPF
jgi:hypothetical protein